MNRILRYALYEGKTFFRVKTAAFYSILFPAMLLLGYYFSYKNTGNIDGINRYFPYLISITMISTAAGLSYVIVNNRIYNTWKFYQFFGYHPAYLAFASGVVYFVISVGICTILTMIMLIILKTADISFWRLLVFSGGIGLGSVIYIQLAVIVGLCINESRLAQTVNTALIYIYIILSGTIFRFDWESMVGKIVNVFPNIHIGHILSDVWNGDTIRYQSIMIIGIYVIVFTIIITLLIRREYKKMLY